MEPVFSADEVILQQEVRQFVNSEKKLSKEKGLSNESFISSLYEKMQEKRWVGMFVPKDYGGAGRTFVDWAIFLEELHYNGAPEIFRTSMDMVSFIGGGMIVPYASHEFKRKFLPPMSTGEVTISVGSTEPDTGTDMNLFITRAEDKGDYYLVNGVKIYNEAHRSNHICVILQTSPGAPLEKKLSVLMVDLRSPGVSMRPLWMMWGLHRDELVMENVKVPKENLLGREGEGWTLVLDSFPCEWGTLGNVGILRRDFERYYDLIKDMYFEEKPLTSNASIKHKLVELALELEIARSMYYKTWWLKEKGKPNFVFSAMSKVISTELWIKLYGSLLEMSGQCGMLEGTQAVKKWPIARLGLNGSYEFSPALTIGGWPTEMQRDYIAQIGLGLPSNR